MVECPPYSWASWQRVEPGFELGKSGIKADVLVTLRALRAGGMPIFPPPPVRCPA